MVAREARDRVARRVTELLVGYEPPDFAHVPNPDAALFLSAIDHRTGFRGAHKVDGEGPYEGSDLLWALGLRAERERPGALSATALEAVAEGEVAAILSVGSETIAGAGLRAELWRELAIGLLDRYRGRAASLIAAAGGRLGGAGGLLERLGGFRAFSDPLRKKSFLVCKLWERRGWLEVADPESWEVCADNVLMRLALRAGLVAPGPVEEVRAATLAAWKQVAIRAGVALPLLDDLLWERGRDDPDLVGAEAGPLREPDRPPGTFYY